MELIGIFVVFLIGLGFIALVQKVAADPAFAVALSSLSPWLGHHAELCGWIAVALAFLITVAIPPVLMMKRSPLGNETALGDVGTYVSTVFFFVAPLLLLPCLGYLLGLGWFAAKTTLAH